jgi:hypothetical protein
MTSSSSPILEGDKFYAHMNEEEVAKNPFFEGRVVHGYKSCSSPFPWAEVIFESHKAAWFSC